MDVSNEGKTVGIKKNLFYAPSISKFHILADAHCQE
jgi:hypothetical protein